MTYQVIARKWRPQTFEEVTGQEAITRTLRNAVEHNRLHHAYIFSGARGVGKTTTARLLAKALNCHKTDKPNAKPCAVDAPDACVSCKEIAESRSIDVLEFDAASHTGVDDIREIILESININPARDRFKIFIIDEVHMLSNSSFNALLKTLEEPPPRVEFIMATTELHKLPDTILSRCQEFEFRTIPLQKIYERIKLIGEAEKIDISDEALKEIARAGQGSMRDAQSAFDQVISFSGGRIGIEDVALALGIAGAEMLARVSNAIAANKPSEALKVVDELISRGQDLRNFCRDLLAFFRDLLVFKMAGDSENLLDTAILSREELKTNSAPFSEADLIRFFTSLGETETKLREATQPRYVLEIGLVKLIEMRRVAPVEKILERLVKLENALLNGSLPVEAKNDQPKSAPPNSTDFAESKAEKKTLTIDFPLEEVPFAVSSSAVSATIVEKIEVKQSAPESILQSEFNSPPQSVSHIEEPENLFPDSEAVSFPPPIQPEENPVQVNESWAKRLESMPVKMPQITAEELEHVEDAWLDADFERKLLQSGDNLTSIKNIYRLVETLLEKTSQNPFADPIETQNARNGTAFAPVKEKSSFAMPVFEDEEISNEMPVLPENPTDEQLWQYAENHPLVKKAMRIFRGKIIEVRRTREST
ncbi:MAG TPA: DNA polymerase III subunit gamma/tau [Pyrinomonadaceae bacterium]|nr:DNA polymerase III subunit gamma/tau [Pyrinomonadaceae bacterium]